MQGWSSFKNVQSFYYSFLAGSAGQEKLGILEPQNVIFKGYFEIFYVHIGTLWLAPPARKKSGVLGAQNAIFKWYFEIFCVQIGTLWPAQSARKN